MSEELDELKKIKKLLVLLLLRNNDIEAKNIAKVLDIDPTGFSREFPITKLFKKKK